MTIFCCFVLFLLFFNLEVSPRSANNHSLSPRLHDLHERAVVKKSTLPGASHRCNRQQRQLVRPQKILAFKSLLNAHWGRIFQPASSEGHTVLWLE